MRKAKATHPGLTSARATVAVTCVWQRRRGGHESRSTLWWERGEHLVHRLQAVGLGGCAQAAWRGPLRLGGQICLCLVDPRLGHRLGKLSMINEVLASLSHFYRSCCLAPWSVTRNSRLALAVSLSSMLQGVGQKSVLANGLAIVCCLFSPHLSLLVIHLGHKS